MHTDATLLTALVKSLVEDDRGASEQRDREDDGAESERASR